MENHDNRKDSPALAPLVADRSQQCLSSRCLYRVGVEGAIPLVSSRGQQRSSRGAGF